MTEETLTAESEKPNRRWGRAEWGPFGLFAFHVAFAAILLWLEPSADSSWDDLRVVAMGVIMVAPLLCSLWAALAPNPLITRLLSALSILVLWVFFVPVTGVPFLGNLAFSGGLFLLYWAGLSMMRRSGGGFLVTSVADLHRVRSITRFRIKDLLLWTAVVAVMLTIGRLVGVGETGVSYSAKSIGSVIAGHLTLAGVYGMALFPVHIVGLSVLRSTKQSLVKRAKICTGIVVVYLSLVYLLQLRVDYSSAGFFLALLGNFYLGAMLTMALSALVLRWSGYRLLRNTIYPLSTQAHPVEVADVRGESR